jgi:hypothetical protein
VAWFYFRNGPGIAQSVAVLFKEETRRRAMNFARLPEAPGAEKGSRRRGDREHANSRQA